MIVLRRNNAIYLNIDYSRMNASTYLVCLLLMLGILQLNFAYIKLFNSENALNVQSYDCIYYKNMTAANNETTPYCIRTEEFVPLNRSFSTDMCENSGKEFTFKSLKEMNVSADEVLKWNSSIEIVDRYAAYITTGYVCPLDSTIIEFYVTFERSNYFSFAVIINIIYSL